MQSDVFVTGGTGYIGSRLIKRLIGRHTVRALVRPGSEKRLPQGAEPMIGNVLDRATYTSLLTSDSVVVHLVGTPHPSPSKAAEFESIDFVSARECIAAARAANVRHFVYVSVAHPAPIMRAYVDVRVRCEALLRESGLSYTILRPWYVLGPGHRWAYALIPLYWIWSLMPSKRDTARRLGLVTIHQMLAALTWAVDTAGSVSRILNVPDIQQLQRK